MRVQLFDWGSGTEFLHATVECQIADCQKLGQLSDRDLGAAPRMDGRADPPAEPDRAADNPIAWAYVQRAKQR